MHTSFFVSAIAALRQKEKAIISCAVAVRQNRNEIGELEELPTGDIPGLAALGEPIGGSVWAITAPKFVEYLSVLDFYDPQLDTLAPSAALGQMLMQQCAKDGVPIRLLPIVGAVETREHDEARRQQGVKLAHHSGTILGIAQSIYRGGAPWYAISAFDAQTKRGEKVPVESSAFLPAQHPYTKLQTQPDQVDGEMDLVPLAATLSRPELSLQLAAAEGPQPGRLRHLIDVATRAVRLRPVWDLTELFNGENLFEFGLAPVPENSSDKADHASPVGQNTTLSVRRIDDYAASSDEVRLPKEIGNIYVDAHRLRIRRKRVKANTSLRKGGPGKIFIFDVPLCSHAALVAELRSSSSSDPLLVRMRVIDQRQGDEIGNSSARLVANKPAKLSIALHDVYGAAAVVVEFSGAEKMEVAIESLRLQ
jgi:hypothetical protein